MSDVIACPSGLTGRMRGMKVREGSSYLYTSQSAGALRWLKCSAGQWLEEA